MNKSSRFSIVIGFFLLAPSLGLRAQGTSPATPFEGTVTWSMAIPQMDEEKHAMNINVKGDKTETEIDMGAMGLIKSYIDRVSKKVYIVIVASKTGMMMDIPSDSAAVIEIKPTGQKLTIAGHPAEEYTMKTLKSDISVWAAPDFPKELRDRMHDAMSGQQDNSIQSAFMQLAAKGLFPVKVVVSQTGETAMSMEFVKYEQKKLDDALFVPPTDLKYRPMPKMGGGGMN